MIETPGLSINFLKKENYSGSHIGTRFYLTAADGCLKACVYPEPWCFEVTPDEQKTWKEFEFTQEGLSEAIAWISSLASAKAP